jgi:hypothetical protein
VYGERKELITSVLLLLLLLLLPALIFGLAATLVPDNMIKLVPNNAIANNNDDTNVHKLICFNNPLNDCNGVNTLNTARNRGGVGAADDVIFETIFPLLVIVFVAVPITLTDDDDDDDDRSIDHNCNHNERNDNTIANNNANIDINGSNNVDNVDIDTADVPTKMSPQIAQQPNDIPPNASHNNDRYRLYESLFDTFDFR